MIEVTHTPFNGPFSGTTQVSRYQKGKTDLDFTEARDSEWQWHQLGHMQVCILLQTDNHASTPPLCFLQAGCPSCRPTNSVKALKANVIEVTSIVNPVYIYCYRIAASRTCHGHVRRYRPARRPYTCCACVDCVTHARVRYEMLL